MSWSESKSARAETEFFRLEDDGMEAWVIFAGEPRVVRRTGMQGRGEQVRYYIPVIVPGGIKTWDMSGKTLDVVAALPDGGFGERFTVTRHGRANDTNTYYEIKPKPLSDEEKDRLAKSGLLQKAGGGTPRQEATVEDTIPF